MGAGLLAKTACQSTLTALTDRIREQARSHRYSARGENRVALFKSFRTRATGAILESFQLPQGG
ncbi:hypothetical protein EMIT0P218_90145 [Pseudomonas sp. IT-P218]